MDVTPHLTTGAALGARVRQPALALLLALLSHCVLDATPHYHLGWMTGTRFSSLGDLGLGACLVALIAWRVGNWWPFATGVAALLPDAPGLKETWEHSVFRFLPHSVWPPPWGIVTQVIVTVLALLWGLRTLETAGSGMP